MRAAPQIITSAMQLYFTNESFINEHKFLRLQGVTEVVWQFINGLTNMLN